MRLAAKLPLILSLLAATVIADDQQAPGIAVGEKAPSLNLVDQHGQLTDLDRLLKKDRMLAIVFHRSADW